MLSKYNQQRNKIVKDHFLNTESGSPGVFWFFGGASSLNNPSTAVACFKGGHIPGPILPERSIYCQCVWLPFQNWNLPRKSIIIHCQKQHDDCIILNNSIIIIYKLFHEVRPILRGQVRVQGEGNMNLTCRDEPRYLQRQILP